MHSCIPRPRPIAAREVVAAAAAGGVVVVGDIADIADNPEEVAGTWFLSRGWRFPCAATWTIRPTTPLVAIIPYSHR